MPSNPETRPSAGKRGYNARWEKARATYLRRNPLCAPCQRAGRTTAATLVHHTVPHRGDSAVFWDSSKWEGRCEVCHHDAQRHEKGGQAETYRGAAADGTPLDPGHRWNRGARWALVGEYGPEFVKGPA